ncbi:MAG: hypothetical protein GWM92_13845 [Gemmatimonadetes bacterium]|nr:hypothetical protein [Gemmatimonadota bacterium]NIR79809.1 hypothetical protein [Gemmatimonadota bacterium]NIT88515.1 hypothetical protein [Gemmatimonadota bacterium]NIU32335.1 hypothetical protein [Gemmatimonadota bacterium]NIU36854.1 hypothetical protein [Gemmatimonadota bacterium]
MRRSGVLLSVLAAALVVACGPGQVVVTAEIEMPDPQGEGAVTRALSGMEVQLLPYDRDQIFDSLEAAHPDPEPEIPDSLMEARDQVAEAQREWRQFETRWNTLRDTLQKISQAMEELSRGEARYVALFREFQDLEGELQTVERQMERAFQRFDSMQQGIIQQSEEIRMAREAWADEAFADAFEVIDAKIQAAGMEPVVDTTDAGGTVTVQAPPGQWWVHARHELPYSELYWNEPIEVSRDAPTEISLTRANAEERPNL